MRLNNQIAVITGAGAGLGKAVALRYAAEGARVVIAEVDAAAGCAAEKEIHDAQGDAFFVATDVAEETEVRAMVKAALERYGRIDILFNNAGIQMYGKDTRLHELSSEVWERTMAVNLRGHFLCAKYAIPSMLQQGRGCIINLASPTGMRGYQRLTAYSASKGGIAAMTLAMAADYSRYHIRVNAIVPGCMDTPMNAARLSDETMRQQRMAMIPCGRLGAAEDLAGLAVFLASDEAEYCMGGFYAVDGGLMAI
ncbi:MAG TPA: SDR family NAD(P)-dependent oxidoreductase [Acidobacteriaceae bacterium]|nr:SDR family NAD(P)-dependent oxidoreductase [Acidobacteriaceae bacterium]